MIRQIAKLVQISFVVCMGLYAGIGRGQVPEPLQIIFTSDRDYWLGRIYVADVNTGNVRQPNDLGRDRYSPAISSDGTEIAFVTTARGSAEITIMDSDGENPRLLPMDYSDPNDPSWSPNSEEIAFSSVYGLFAIHVESARIRRILDTKAGTIGYDVGWSPDGERIAFLLRPDGGNSGIFSVQSDGTNLKQLTDGFSIGFSWSPDGKQILFAKRVEEKFELCVMNADGTDQHPLADPPVYGTYPSWTSDGKKVAFTSGEVGTREIYIMNVDGSNRRNITNHPADDWDPVWFPIPKNPTLVSPNGKLTTSWGLLKRQAR